MFICICKLASAQHRILVYTCGKEHAQKVMPRQLKCWCAATLWCYLDVHMTPQVEDINVRHACHGCNSLGKKLLKKEDI